MLADETVEGMVYLVLVRTVVAQRAVAFAEGFTNGSTRIEAKSIFPFQKIGEGEVDGWRRMI